MNVIEAKDISKQYIVSHEKDALIRNILPYIFRRKYQEKFWALKGINFSLRKGESLGIVGPNGAGKSTLLNILAGISTPTEGSVNIKGRVSSILTLGAGFHPELTGIENIFLNGSILGMTLRELKKKLDDIIQFSELSSFIDAPIQTYSTGMVLRLGFSIAVHVEFDILLVDEILLVGDLYFQKKCINKMEEFRRRGKTLVISSQSLPLVESLTDKMLLLNQGEIVDFGKPYHIIERYKNLNRIDRKDELQRKAAEIIKNKMIKEDKINVEKSWALMVGSKEAEIICVRLLNRWRFKRRTFRTGDRVYIEVLFKVHREIKHPHFGVAIFTEDRTYCYGPNTMFDDIKIERLKPGTGKFCLTYNRLLLCPGEYYLSVAIWDRDEISPYDYHCACYKFRVFGKKRYALYYEPYRYKVENLQDCNIGESSNNEFKIVLRDRYYEEGNIFQTGSGFNILLEFSCYGIDLNNPIMISREDNIVCFALDNIRMHRPRNGKLSVKIEIPELHLLPGNYHIYFGERYIGDFTVISDKKDHGLVYMPHKWNIKIP